MLFLPQNFNSIAPMAFRVVVNHHHRYVVDNNRIQAGSGTIRGVPIFRKTGTHKDTPASTTLLVLSVILTQISKHRSSHHGSVRKPYFLCVFLKGVFHFERFHL